MPFIVNDETHTKEKWIKINQPEQTEHTLLTLNPQIFNFIEPNINTYTKLVKNNQLVFAMQMMEFPSW